MFFTLSYLMKKVGVKMRRTYSLVLFQLIFVLYFNYSIAQTYYWKSYSSLKKANVILLDGDYLWAATKGGIAKYDLQNHTYKVFDMTNSSLRNFDFNCGYKMNNGEIWFGMREGICKIKNDNLVYQKDIGNILKVYQASDGTIWYSKYDYEGVIKIVNGVDSLITYGSYWDDYYLWNVNAIARDKNGAMWFGTLEHGLYKLSNNQWQYFKQSNSNIPSNSVIDIEIDNQNRVWIATNNGVGIYDQNADSWQIIRKENGLLSNGVLDILIVNDSAYLALKNTYDYSSPGGVQIYANGQFTDVFSSTLASALCLAKSNNGKLYYSLTSELFNENDGIFEYDGDISYKIYLSSYDFYSNKINSIAANSKGDVFFSNYKYIFKLSPHNNFSSYYDNIYGYSDNEISVLYVDSKDRLWFSQTRTEYIILNYVSYPVKAFTGSYCNSYPYENVTGFFFKDSLNMFVTSRKGLYKNKVIDNNPENVSYYNTSNSPLPSNVVNAAVMTQQNILWIATDKGLAKVSGSNWQIYNISNSPLRSNNVTDLKIDKNGNIWVANGALLKINPNGTISVVDETCTWSEISIAADNTIWGISSSSLQAWNGTIRHKFSLEENNLPIPSYDWLRALAIDKYNRVWVGTYYTGAFSLTVDQKLEFPFEKVWEKLANNNYFIFTQNGNRGIAYSNRKIYMTSFSANTKIAELYVFDAYSGSIIKKLDTTGIKGGTYSINDIETSEDGKIFVCNLTTNSGTSPFKIYKWNNDNSRPEVFISYQSQNYRLGDNFRVVGNFNTTAVIYAPAANTNKVLKWIVKNGALQSQTPQIISLQNYMMKTIPSVYPISSSENSNFFVNSNNTRVALFKSDGVKIDSINANVIPLTSSALSYFTYNNKNFLAAFQYVANIYDTNRQNIRLAELITPYNTMNQNSIYGITERMGPEENANATGDVVSWIDGSNVYIAVLATNSGLAVYRCSKAPFNEIYTSAEFFDNERGIDPNKNFEIYQNYPNPFNGYTTIKYSLPEKCDIEISVYDILGRQIFSETIAGLNKGEYFYRLDANALNFSSGIYIYST